MYSSKNSHIFISLRIFIGIVILICLLRPDNLDLLNRKGVTHLKGVGNLLCNIVQLRNMNISRPITFEVCWKKF